MATYRDTVMADAPIAYYRLGETTGTAINDETLGARTGTYYGPPTLGLVGALRYDNNTAIGITTASGAAGTQYGQILNVPSYASFSAECWVWYDSAGSDANQAMMELAVNDTTNTDWLLYYEGDRIAWRVINDAAATVNSNNPNVTPRDTWQHVVGTYTAGTMRLYVNGTQVASAALTRTNPKTGTAINLWLGRLASSSTYALNGRLDECAFYDKELTAAQVAAHYDAGANQPPPPFSGTAYSVSLNAPTLRRGVALSVPSGDYPAAYPERTVAGVVYDALGADRAGVEGATVLLIRQSDNVTVAQQFSGPGGYYLFYRGRDDPNRYFVVAYSILGGTTQVHGTSDRNLVPQ